MLRWWCFGPPTVVVVLADPPLLWCSDSRPPDCCGGNIADPTVCGGVRAPFYILISLRQKIRKHFPANKIENTIFWTSSDVFQQTILYQPWVFQYYVIKMYIVMHTVSKKICEMENSMNRCWWGWSESHISLNCQQCGWFHLCFFSQKMFYYTSVAEPKLFNFDSSSGSTFPQILAPAPAPALCCHLKNGHKCWFNNIKTLVISSEIFLSFGRK